jgi:lysophospholipase
LINCSYATFQLQYTPKETRILFDQVFTNQISGFVPNTNKADPNFGKCLQCAAIDRARLANATTANPNPIPRSDFCTTCFKQYCYDPNNPPSKDALPGRKLTFVDPDPSGFSQVTGFLGMSKFKLIGGLIGLLVFIALAVGGLVWWRRRRERKGVYKAVNGLHDEDVDSAMLNGSRNRSSSYADYVRPQAQYELPAFTGDSLRPMSMRKDASYASGKSEE